MAAVTGLLLTVITFHPEVQVMLSYVLIRKPINNAAQAHYGESHETNLALRHPAALRRDLRHHFHGIVYS
jgi:hypothetical protein